MSKKTDKAISLFNNGYNCSQAAFLGAREENDALPFALASRLSGTFGGGVGGLGQTCGAICGAMMAICEENYPDGAATDAEKSAARAPLKQLGADFERRFGSCLCSELKDKAPARTDGLKPCTAYVEWCVAYTEAHR